MNYTEDIKTAGLLQLDLLALAALIRSGQVSPVEITRAQLRRIATLDGDLRSYAHVTAASALQEAQAAEREIRQGCYRGPLHGVPIALKDLFRRKGVPMAAGTAIHRGRPADHDATVVGRLRDAGAVLLGQLQMTEGAYSDHHPDVAPPA